MSANNLIHSFKNIKYGLESANTIWKKESEHIHTLVQKKILPCRNFLKSNFAKDNGK